MPNYGNTEYWDNRYRQQNQTTFDWLESWEEVQEIVE